jgi:coenzyme F420-reducing hydrogenase alpha subunit
MLDSHVRGVNYLEAAGVFEVPQALLIHHYKVNDRVGQPDRCYRGQQSGDRPEHGPGPQTLHQNGHIHEGMLNLVSAAVRTCDFCLRLGAHLGFRLSWLT